SILVRSSLDSVLSESLSGAAFAVVLAGDAASLDGALVCAALLASLRSLSTRAKLFCCAALSVLETCEPPVFGVGAWSAGVTGATGVMLSSAIGFPFDC